MKSNSDLLYWIALLNTPGIGQITARRIKEQVPTLHQAKELEEADWLQKGLRHDIAQSLCDTLHKEEYVKIVDSLERTKVRIVLEADEHYPPSLRQIPHPPPLLFYVGQLEPFVTSVAIVGTRKCTSYGTRVAQEIAADVVKSGGVVISGLAYGIDHAAHVGAVNASGRTVAVLGSGVGEIYPREHRDLARRIVEQGGAIISEFLPWEKPLRRNFPQRNRVISGMAQAVVVVEAAKKSGSLITAAYAVEQNRDVAAVPGSIFSVYSQGPHELIADGAIPLFSTHDVLHTLGLAVPASENSILSEQFDSAHEKKLTDAEEMVLRELSTHAKMPGELSAALSVLGIPVGQLSMVLMQLELAGRIRRDSVGMYTI